MVVVLEEEAADLEGADGGVRFGLGVGHEGRTDSNMRGPQTLVQVVGNLADVLWPVLFHR